MQSSDLKILTLGIFSLGFLGYYFNKYTQQQKYYKEKMKQFNQCYQYSQKNKQQPLTSIMTKKNQLSNETEKIKEKMFCFVDIKPKYNDSTFSLYERQRSIFQKYDKYPDDKQILEHQMGGDFTFSSNYADLICQLNDFCLSGKLLYEKKKTPVHIFQGINKIKPIVCTVLTALKTMNISIYGKLFYDDSQATWTVEPFFITPSFNLRQTVEQFYRQKSQLTTYLKFAILISGLVVGYFTVLKTLKLYFNKRKTDYFVEGSDIDFFRNKEYISVKGQSLLNCQLCKDRNVEMVYQCGHLVLCKQCHQKNLQKICPLCKKQSRRFMKIFMA